VTDFLVNYSEQYRRFVLIGEWGSHIDVDVIFVGAAYSMKSHVTQRSCKELKRKVLTETAVLEIHTKYPLDINTSNFILNAPV
jgi:hypothetical protein